MLGEGDSVETVSRCRTQTAIRANRPNNQTHADAGVRPDSHRATGAGCEEVVRFRVFLESDCAAVRESSASQNPFLDSFQVLHYHGAGFSGTFIFGLLGKENGWNGFRGYRTGALIANCWVNAEAETIAAVLHERVAPAEEQLRRMRERSSLQACGRRPLHGRACRQTRSHL